MPEGSSPASSLAASVAGPSAVTENSRLPRLPSRNATSSSISKPSWRWLGSSCRSRVPVASARSAWARNDVADEAGLRLESRRDTLPGRRGVLRINPVAVVPAQRVGERPGVHVAQMVDESHLGWVVRQRRGIPRAARGRAAEIRCLATRHIAPNATRANARVPSRKGTAVRGTAGGRRTRRRNQAPAHTAACPERMRRASIPPELHRVQRSESSHDA